MLRSLGLLPAVAVAAAAAASAASPIALPDRSFAAALRQRSVHYELRTSVAVGARTTMVCDVGRGLGIQRITFSQGGRTAHVVIRVVRRTAYVRGGFFALNGYMGFHEAASRRYAGRWIRIPHGDRAFAAVADAATLRTEIDHLRFVSVDPPTLPGRIDGRTVLVVRGTRSRGPLDAAWLYVRARGVPLPVASRANAFSGATYITRFSNWNERVGVEAPARSVSITTTGLE